MVPLNTLMDKIEFTCFIVLLLFELIVGLHTHTDLLTDLLANKKEEIISFTASVAKFFFLYHTQVTIQIIKKRCILLSLFSIKR